MPLSMSWLLKSDLGTLTGAEVHGAPLSLSGDALLSGYYVNELLLHFLHRHDPQPDIFDLYAQSIQSLAAAQSIAPCLRQFEIELLRQIGYALNFEHESTTQQALQSHQYYEYRVEQGPVEASKNEGSLVFSGAMLTAIGAQEFDDPDTLRAANRLMREVVSFHLGGKELKSRKVLLEIHRNKNV